MCSHLVQLIKKHTITNCTSPPFLHAYNFRRKLSPTSTNQVGFYKVSSGCLENYELWCAPVLVHEADLFLTVLVLLRAYSSLRPNPIRSAPRKLSAVCCRPFPVVFRLILRANNIRLPQNACSVPRLCERNISRERFNLHPPPLVDDWSPLPPSSLPNPAFYPVAAASIQAAAPIK